MHDNPLSSGGAAPAPVDHGNCEKAWQEVLEQGTLPAFVRERLEQTASGHQPWIEPMTPAELLVAKSHGMPPLATVSATRWFQDGCSLPEGQMVRGFRNIPFGGDVQS